MDYKVPALTRKKIQKLADIYREIFLDCVSIDGYYFDVIKAFEMTSVIFPNVITSIVPDDSFSKNVPARCIPDMNGKYIIQIKQYVYDGAVLGKGGYRMHIQHELCHPFLCMLGFGPFMNREYKNYTLHNYESMEWQTKALAGEILMNYDLTNNMSINEIIDKCVVSSSAARRRKKY